MEITEALEAAYKADPTIGRERLIRQTGCGEWDARKFLASKHAPPNKTPSPQDTVSEDYKGSTAEISVNSLRIKTLPEALHVAKVDLSQWEVERYTVNSWEVTMRGENGPEQATNHQVKLWLKRLTPAMSGFASLIDNVTPRKCSKNHAAIPATNDPHMLEISLMDHHFGKLAWKPETGSDYDLKIAAALYHNAVSDLVGKAKSFGVDEILIPLGSDFFNIDNNANTTTGGTPQDCDGRLAKIFEVGCQSVLSAIDLCAQVAKVKVIWVPGNHDATSSYYLCKYIEAWYRDCQRVTVDSSPTSRKYVPYGVNLLGFSHGCDEKTDSLPLLMMAECRDILAGVQHCEIHIGHLHKRKEMKYTAGDTMGPVTVRILPSLSGTDRWHYGKGFVGGLRAAEAYLWSKNSGYVGHFSAVAREG